MNEGPLAERRASAHIAPMFERLRRRAAEARPAAEAPPGTRVYAVGDIHGRSDLLDRMHDMIRVDALSRPEAEKVVIYLGDYVDRGDDSRGVVARLIERPLAGFRMVALCGNHEAFLLRFLDDPEIGPAWIANGGDATLYSYGVNWRPAFGEGDLAGVSEAFRRVLPADHLDFFRALALSDVEGDYLFVHAGIRPDVALAAQSPDDLMWIRGEFLESDADHGHVVVHGHTITETPELRDNRIGIDTGAFATGRLTCLVLDGADRRLLQT
jgi:diadenosine tetraphosphatase ApaH/serine/threonine PP2A family protein phosphatase